MIRPKTVEESTGLGMWQTVTTSIINEEEEYEKQQQRIRDEENEKVRLKQVLYQANSFPYHSYKHYSLVKFNFQT